MQIIVTFSTLELKLRPHLSECVVAAPYQHSVYMPNIESDVVAYPWSFPRRRDTLLGYPLHLALIDDHAQFSPYPLISFSQYSMEGYVDFVSV